MLTEISQTQRTNTVWFQIYEIPREVKFTETESKLWLPRTENRENGESPFNGYRVSVKVD